VTERAGTFFRGTGITNTGPLRPNFGLLFAFRNLFQKKDSAGFAYFEFVFMTT
jgi:hypothetical protein